MYCVNLLAVLVTLIATNDANAACSYASTSGPWPWNFKVYTGTGCTGKSYEYHGTSPIAKCYNIASPLADHVNSFVFSAQGGKRVIEIFQDADCTGKSLGLSKGNWKKDPTSAGGRGMSSFAIGA